jgi:hypothetical protein
MALKRCSKCNQGFPVSVIAPQDARWELDRAQLHFADIRKLLHG